MGFTNQAQIDVLRKLAFGSITTSYVALGSAVAYQARIICFTNLTDENVIISQDGKTEQMIVPAGSYKLIDVTTNHRPINQDDFCFSAGIQWYVKGELAPSVGAVYLEIIYAQSN